MLPYLWGAAAALLVLRLMGVPIPWWAVAAPVLAPTLIALVLTGLAALWVLAFPHHAEPHENREVPQPPDPSYRPMTWE